MNNEFMTKESWGETFKKANDTITEFQRLYMAEFIDPWISEGDECLYLNHRGEWVPAIFIEHLIEDRSYYVIEWVCAQGFLRREKTTIGYLRERRNVKNT